MKIYDFKVIVEPDEGTESGHPSISSMTRTNCLLKLRYIFLNRRNKSSSSFTLAFLLIFFKDYHIAAGYT